MQFINKTTGEVISTNNRRILLHTVLSSVYLQFMLESDTLAKETAKYKNVPLLPYIMTDKDKEKIALNPDTIEDIPRFIVKGYDKAVSASYFDQKVWDEFITRYNQNDERLCTFINRYHPVFKATLDVSSMAS